MPSQMIQFQGNGNPYDGYLSTPDGKGPGVVVLQEYWGLVDHIKHIANRFAKEGFTALAPDLYHGKKATSPDEAGKMFMALNIADAEKTLRGAIQRLLTDSSCASKAVGVVGFCMGGQLALYAASTNPDQVSAVVDFYGVHPNVHPPLEKLKAPVLGIFAEKDKSVNPGVVSSLSRQLDKLGKAHEFHTYKGREHAFFNDTRPNVYDAHDAADAWQKTINFFRQHLKA